MIEEKEKNKKTLLITIVGVLILIIAVVGISYAAWNYVFNGTLTNTLSTADISLELLESNDNVISITNALPMGCTQGKQQEETFDFAVTSKTTKDVNIKYTLSIQKLEVDSGYTALNDNQIAVYLTDYTGASELLPSSYDCPITGGGSSSGGGASQASNPVEDFKDLKPTQLYDNETKGTMKSLASNDTGHISLISQLNNYKLYTGRHTHDATHNKVQDKFKLRVWIAEDVDASNWNENTKLQYKFKIGLTSEEKEKGSYPSIIYRYGTNTVGPGTSITPVSGTKYVITDGNQDAPVGPYETQSECQTALEGFGSPAGYSCQQKTGTFGGFDYTEDYTELNKTYFLKHNISTEGTVESSEVCYILNSTLYCLKGEKTDDKEDGYISQYYEENTNILKTSFGESNCSVISHGVLCSVSGLYAGANQFGNVSAYFGSSHCGVGSRGDSRCDE